VSIHNSGGKLPASIFARYDEDPAYCQGGYPYKFRGELFFPIISGGTPSNPDVAEAWIRSKGYKDIKDELIAGEVACVMEERGLPEAAAIDEVAKRRMLNGFRRDETGLYIEGRCLKACLKEAFSVAADVGKLPIRGFGENKRKGVKSFVAEHVFVVEQRLHLLVDGKPAQEPTHVQQSFVHTFRGNGISYQEMMVDATVQFTVESDFDFSEPQWAAVWLTAQNQGLGAGRSQEYGRFVATSWKAVQRPPKTKRNLKAA
jgi:hypothetical protein